MGKITVNDGPSSNRPWWEDPEPEPEPEVVPEPEPAPKRAAKPAAKPVPEA